MDKALTLSLVIPVYNEERHLKACLDAIAAQTERPDEVILIDNNSRDASVDIIRQYSFAKLIHEPNQGIVYARNTGFDAAGGDLIARIDADTILPADWVHRVKHFYAHGQHRHMALTGGGYFYNLRLPRLNGWLQSQLAYRVNRFVIGHYILWGSNMVMPRAAWEAARTETCNRTDIHEDMDLGIHVVQHNYRIHYDATLAVGVELKRVWHSRNQLKRHMRRWPQSLKVHGYSRWWLGVLGNWFLWYIVQPFFMACEYIARLFGKRSITD